MARKIKTPASKPVAKITRPVRAPKPIPVVASAPAKAEAVKPAAPVAVAAPAPTPVAAPVVTPAVVKAETVTPQPLPVPEAPTPTAAPRIDVPSEKTTPISKGTTPMATNSTFSPEKILTDLNARTKTAFEKSAKFGEDFAELAKGNLEAVAESAKIAAKGAETIAQGAADYTKKNFETATAAMKRYSSVKSPAELFQLNSELAKSSFDSAVAEASKMSEAFTKLAGEIFQPLSNRYTITAEKLKASAF